MSDYTFCVSIQSGSNNLAVAITFNPSYVGSRDIFVFLVGVKHVLDIGCSVGASGKKIKAALGAGVIGIEL